MPTLREIITLVIMPICIGIFAGNAISPTWGTGAGMGAGFITSIVIQLVYYSKRGK